MSAHTTQQFNRILIIQPNPTSREMLWHLGAIHALRSSTPHLTLLADPSSQAKELFQNDRLVDEYIWLSPTSKLFSYVPYIFSLASKLREKKFDAVWIFDANPLYTVLAKLACIPYRFGTGGKLQRLLLTHSLKASRKQMSATHPTDRSALLLKLNNVKIEPDDYWLSVQDNSMIEQRFDHLPHPWICLGIDSLCESQRWSARKYIELAIILSQPGYNTIFVCGLSPERDVIQHICREIRFCGRQAIPVTSLSLLQYAALFQKSDLFIGNDATLLHIAACTDVPTAGLFGASQPPPHYVPNLYAIQPRPSARPKTMSGMSVIDVLKGLRHHRLLDRSLRVIMDDMFLEEDKPNKDWSTAEEA